MAADASALERISVDRAEWAGAHKRGRAPGQLRPWESGVAPGAVRLDEKAW